jgi:hypothetical protein
MFNDNNCRRFRSAQVPRMQTKGIIKRRIPGWLDNPDVQSGIEQFKMTAIDTDISGSRTFDLLQNYIRSDKRVVQLDPRYRCVNSQSMYSKIIESYNELLPDINRIMPMG